MTDTAQGLSWLHVDQLHLDQQNPRLPEQYQGQSEAAVLGYLYDEEVLEELAQSMVDNGFFEHEPLIVSHEEGRLVVIEGNRRFAALVILLQLPLAREMDLEFDLRDPLPAERREELSTVPCWLTDRDDVHRFLGFRHIGGLRKWSAEAKARYLAAEVDLAVRRGSEDPFYDVGRRVGSNALGVRNPYTALAILRAGREQFGIDSRYVQQERFGVWNRCMNSAPLKSYIGLGDPRTYQEVTDAVRRLDNEHLAEVISDLTPSGERRKAVLADSREVTLYGQVLQSPAAHNALREYGNLELAKQVVDDAALPDRVQHIADRLDLLLKEVHRAGDGEALRVPVENVYSRASTLRAAVRGLLEDSD